MKPLCLLILLGTSLVCDAAEKPSPLQKEGEPLPVVAMPLGKFPAPNKVPEPPLLEKAHPPGTKVAIEGKFQVANGKDFQRAIVSVKFRVKLQNRWVTAESAGGRPVKVKDGIYHYRVITKTPKYPRIYRVEVYEIFNGRELISTARVDVDEDVDKDPE